METRRLGRTGHLSSVAILGAAALWRADADDAEAVFALAERHGVNHLDIAPRYGDAQAAAGPALASRRHRWFVACKTAEPSRDGARADLERSLELLRTDHVDLYQLHAVTSIEELDRRAGAMEAVLAARDEGLVRAIGVTGHDLGAPAAHHEAIRRYDVDTVMFPVYPRVWADPTYRARAEALLARCLELDVGAMAIKAVARRPWAPGERPLDSPWYRPQRDPVAIARGIRFALSTPGITGFCTPGSQGLLPAVLAAAEAYEPLDDTAREAAMAAMAADELIFPLADKAQPLPAG
ncbi:MAG: aldo/keto reductase [Acidimicrobiia bacterium]